LACSALRVRVFSVVRVLLDECLPRGLARELAGHEVDTVTQLGWSGVTNGELLRRAAGRYDFLITIDQRFAEGDSVPSSVTLITLVARSNRLESLRPLLPAVLDLLLVPRGGERIRVGA
jgi:hypothetical protein